MAPECCYTFSEDTPTWYPWILGALTWALCAVGILVGLFCLLKYYIPAPSFAVKKVVIFLCCCLIGNSINLATYYPVLWICGENVQYWFDFLGGLTALFLCYSMMSVYIVFVMRIQIALKDTSYQISRCFELFLKLIGLFMVLLSVFAMAVIVFFGSAEAVLICLIFWLIYLLMSIILTLYLCRGLYFIVQDNLMESGYFQTQMKKVGEASEIAKYLTNLLSLKKCIVETGVISTGTSKIEKGATAANNVVAAVGTNSELEQTLQLAQIIIKFTTCVGISALSTILSFVGLVLLGTLGQSVRPLMPSFGIFDQIINCYCLLLQFSVGFDLYSKHFYYCDLCVKQVCLKYAFTTKFIRSASKKKAKAYENNVKQIELEINVCTDKPGKHANKNDSKKDEQTVNTTETVAKTMY